MSLTAIFDYWGLIDPMTNTVATIVDVPEAYDPGPGWIKVRWDGTFRVGSRRLPDGSWQHPPTPDVPDLAGFQARLEDLLDGATPAERLQRALDLRLRFPGFTEAFLRTLDPPETPRKAAWRQALWAAAVARIGTPQQVITPTERDRFLQAAAEFKVPLTAPAPPPPTPIA